MAISAPANTGMVIAIEKMRPILATIGLDVREVAGQTIWPIMNPDGVLHEACFYIGKIGAKIEDNKAWTEVRFGN